MNALSAATSLLAHSLIWALLNSIWQGALLYVTLYVVLKTLTNTNARVKYYLSFGTLSVLFVWFADTWVSQYQRLKGTTVYITQSGADAAANSTYSVKAIPGGAIQSHLLSQVLPHVEHYFPLFMVVYALGLAFMLLRFFVAVLQVTRLRKQGLAQPEIYWTNFISQWQQQFEIARPVKLFLSGKISTPIMIGAIKPIILLPIAAISHLTTEQLESILLHELAHIKRHDYLLNIFQAVAEAILFFNPFVWLISRAIRREREHCCDDLAVAYSENPLPYARALSILEEQRTSNTGLALAASGNKNQLFNRIKRIMEMKKSNINYGQLTIIIVAILALTCTIAMFTFTPSFAQKVKTGTGDTTSKKVYSHKTIIVDKNGKKTITENDSPPKSDNTEDNDDADIKPAGKNKNTKSYSYSYTYSDDDNDDIKKAMKEVSASIEAVDWDAIRDEINKGLEEVNKELNDPKLKKEINGEVRKALKKSKEAMESAMEKVESMPPMPPPPPIPPVPPVPPVFPHDREEGKSMSSSFRPMLEKMEQDGLINSSLNYKIEAEKGKLYINDKKQPDEVYKRYKQYLGNQKVTIENEDGKRKVILYDE